ncbi:MAG: transposase [Lachnospiraceae bacterium]|jgi:SRSO17 transposase|nr:transposase [Lachnospiraceae bacterium]
MAIGVAVRPAERTHIITSGSATKRAASDHLYESLREVLEKSVWDDVLLNEADPGGSLVNRLPQELFDYLIHFLPLFHHAKQRVHFITYVKGLLSYAPRKFVGRFATTIGNESSVRMMQSFMCAAKWDDAALQGAYQELAAKVLSEPDGMFTLGVFDVIRKGNQSVGVARQFCTRTGKTENCQTGIVLGYTSTQNGHGLIDAELFLPKKWFSDEYEPFREKCGIPPLVSKSKAEIANCLLNRMYEQGKFKGRWVGVGQEFSSDTRFLDSIPYGLSYFADVGEECMVFPVKAGGGVAEKAVSVRSLAGDASIPWHSVCYGMGSDKMPLISKEKVMHVYEMRQRKPGRMLWLYIREDARTNYALCNASTAEPLATIRTLASRRWSFAPCFEWETSALGLDQYVGRSWTGWHRHTLMVFIAHLFLTAIKRKGLRSTLPLSDSSEYQHGRRVNYCRNVPEHGDHFTLCNMKDTGRAEPIVCALCGTWPSPVKGAAEHATKLA